MEQHAARGGSVLPAVSDSAYSGRSGHLVRPAATGPGKDVRLVVQEQLLPH